MLGDARNLTPGVMSHSLDLIFGTARIFSAVWQHASSRRLVVVTAAAAWVLVVVVIAAHTKHVTSNQALHTQSCARTHSHSAIHPIKLRNRSERAANSVKNGYSIVHKASPTGKFPKQSESASKYKNTQRNENVKLKSTTQQRTVYCLWCGRM